MDEGRLRELAVLLRARIEPGVGGVDLMRSLLRFAAKSDDDFLDLVDGALQVWASKSRAQSLSRVLAAGGSIWTVADDGLSLELAVSDQVQATFVSASSQSDEASIELREAWSNAFGRNGDPSDAWGHAIKALEDLLIPVVVPQQTKPTLGHVVGQLRRQGLSWEFVLPGKDGNYDVDPLVGMLELVWPNHDRHGGSGDKQRPSQQEARAVTTLAATILQWHREGWVVRPRV
ncbi:hypothetical protein GCM10007298_06180 [Williamsia phyllosphaerae]|uniref:AbiV family abortive infection protein n=2 Tax=Williamsia phyllosphaerae TaxID=885042 RepID=A0ABQ1UAA3_9NOCA|nr:hypothetical protein GCM10007298_06180 [Williamsia phyllosphaerae]